MSRAGLAATLLVLATGCTYYDGQESRTRTFSVPASSMEPTIRCARPAPGCTAAKSDTVRTRSATTFSRGDIVVFETPRVASRLCGAGGTYVKRIVALPGETWSVRGGLVYVDGSRLPEPYVTKGRRSRDSHRRRKVPPDAYAVLGDNRQQSCDSRVWGHVPGENIRGKVVAIERG